jgi:hypothetical protein
MALPNWMMLLAIPLALIVIGLVGVAVVALFGRKREK